MDAIRTEGLGKVFGPTVAVDRLTLSVDEGEIFGLVGPDGAGKTTMMRLLAGILDPRAGTAGWWAFDPCGGGEDQGEIGYMSQRFGLYPDLTVMENIDFYADIYDVPRRGGQEKIDAAAGVFSNLTPFKRRLAGNLSGGMKQKLGLACALIHTPKVLFLDEPTNGVDPVSRRDFWRILYQLLREKVTIFVSTAYLDEAERCQRLALLHQGKLLALGTPDEVKGSMPGGDPGSAMRRAPAGGRGPAGRASPRNRRAVRRPGARGQPGALAGRPRDREGPAGTRGSGFPGIRPSSRSSKTSSSPCLRPTGRREDERRPTKGCR